MLCQEILNNLIEVGRCLPRCDRQRCGLPPISNSTAINTFDNAASWTSSVPQPSVDGNLASLFANQSIPLLPHPANDSAEATSFELLLPVSSAAVFTAEGSLQTALVSDAPVGNRKSSPNSGYNSKEVRCCCARCKACLSNRRHRSSLAERSSNCVSAVANRSSRLASGTLAVATWAVAQANLAFISRRLGSGFGTPQMLCSR